VRGRRRTHLVTGYVHKPYPRIYALLARHAGFDTVLIVRGVEGGVIPGLTQTGKLWRVLGDAEEVPMECKPAELGIEAAVRAARREPRASASCTARRCACGASVATARSRRPRARHNLARASSLHAATKRASSPSRSSRGCTLAHQAA
jgi:anthranilate phosphoribosyltransferase